ncbi:MAG: O-antigen ligase family protein [Candidatus Coatesbacteria bacterium]
MAISPGLLGLGAGLMGACALEPAWGLWLLLAATIVEVRTDTTLGFTVYASEVVFACVLAVWAAVRGRAVLRDPAHRSLLVASCFMVVAAFVSGVLAGTRADAVKGALRWAEFAGVALMASDAGARGVFSRRLVVGGLALVALVLSVQALADARPWVLRLDDAPARIVFRLPGGAVVWRAAGFEHPNVLAAALFPCAAVCAAAWIALPVSSIAIAALAASGLAGATIVLTYSRGGLLGWLAAMAAVLAAGLMGPAKRGALVRFAGAVAVTAALVRLFAAPAALAEQVRSVRTTAVKMAGIAGGHSEGKRLKDDLMGEASQAEMAVGSLNDRKLMAETAGRIHRAHPWFGAGPGGWRREAPALAPAEMTAAGLTHHPHNLYLLVLCEGGLAGFAAFVILVIALIRGPARIGPWPAAAFQYAWVGIFAGFLAVSAFDVPLVHARGMGFAFLLGLLRWPLPEESRA